MPGLTGVCLVLSALALAARSPVSAQTASPSEYQVKAIFLFNIVQFVDWPPAAFADAQAPLVVGVLGKDPFGAYLDETFRGETASNRPVIVQRYRRVEEIETCHLLFISVSEARHLEQILARLKDRSILTVADGGSGRRGVGIQFVTVQNKIRMKIDLEAASAAHLTISSKLLKLAEIVTPGGN